ncbi:hypothetical protein AAY473_018676 [Plecturocebus cupreus]
MALAPVIPATWKAEAGESLEAEVAVSRNHITALRPGPKSKTQPKEREKERKRERENERRREGKEGRKGSEEGKEGREGRKGRKEGRKGRKEGRNEKTAGLGSVSKKKEKEKKERRKEGKEGKDGWTWFKYIPLLQSTVAKFKTSLRNMEKSHLYKKYKNSPGMVTPLWEAEMGGSLEARAPDQPDNMAKLHLYKKYKNYLGVVVIPATRQADAQESLGPGRQRSHRSPFQPLPPASHTPCRKAHLQPGTSPDVLSKIPHLLCIGEMERSPHFLSKLH